MRKRFVEELYKWMLTDKDIIVITCDLGYKMFDKIRDDFPDRFYNVGAAEQAGMGIAVGLAMSGKKPFIYSITPFLLWRPAETIRLYVNGESVPVRLVGGGRDKDYAHDGPSHDASDDMALLRLFPSVECGWPGDDSVIAGWVERMVKENRPFYINLRR